MPNPGCHMAYYISFRMEHTMRIFPDRFSPLSWLLQITLGD
mgnify:CR=1 FL=1